ncbi:MAG: MurR/RpiR family transcriptional regulator [Rhodospirillaceae bacterium]|nr:MurR/RpiR family transcriptional regulator [Rhodospirillaceae bacterium]MBL6940608.1 MurR/RpiR family transcriptional regulator [Rhodospirillales bacterium]
MPQAIKNRPRLSIAEDINRNIDYLTRTERQCARVLLSNYPFIGLEKVASFAKRAEVSAPTILRLVGKLGFSGYPEFQQRLREELEERLQTPLTKHEEPQSALEDDDFLAKYSNSVERNLSRTLKALPRAEFEAVLKLLSDVKRPVHLAGGKLTSTIADYFYRHLIMVRPNVRRIENDSYAWSEHLIDMDRRDVVIIFDVRRYQPELLELARLSSQCGARVVLFTDQWLSPVSGIANHVIPVRIDVPSSWDSAVSTLMVVEAMIAALSNRDWSRVEARVKAREKLAEKSRLEN